MEIWNGNLDQSRINQVDRILQSYVEGYASKIAYIRSLGVDRCEDLVVYFRAYWLSVFLYKLNDSDINDFLAILMDDLNKNLVRNLALVGGEENRGNLIATFNYDDWREDVEVRKHRFDRSADDIYENVFPSELLAGFVDNAEGFDVSQFSVQVGVNRSMYGMMLRTLLTHMFGSENTSAEFRRGMWITFYKKYTNGLEGVERREVEVVDSLASLGSVDSGIRKMFGNVDTKVVEWGALVDEFVEWLEFHNLDNTQLYMWARVVKLTSDERVWNSRSLVLFGLVANWMVDFSDQYELVKSRTRGMTGDELAKTQLELDFWKRLRDMNGLINKWLLGRKKSRKGNLVDGNDSRLGRRRRKK